MADVVPLYQGGTQGTVPASPGTRSREERTLLEAGPDSFKRAMRNLPGGVVLVTTWIDGRPWGMTVSSCCAVSANPPKILVSLGRRTSSRSAILESGIFGLDVLCTDQRRLAELGAAAGVAKFVDEFCLSDRPGDLHSPTTASALCHLDCTLDVALEVSDHTLIIGDVTKVLASGEEPRPGEQPLVYCDRAFRSLGEEVDD